MSSETRSTAVCSKQTDFEAGIACFCPSLATYMGENWVAAMKFEISGFYSSGNLFQARGLGKQHGFRKSRSWLTHLLKHIDDIIQSLLNDNDHNCHLTWLRQGVWQSGPLNTYPQAASAWSTRKVIKMKRAVSHQQETIRHHKWFPFNACSRLEWRSSRVSFRTYSFPYI